MAAYIGHTVTVELKNSGGKFCGKLIRTDNVKGMIVLSKGNVSHNKLHVCMLCLLYFQLQSSQNKVYLNASTLMLNINEKEFDQTVDDMKKKR